MSKYLNSSVRPKVRGTKVLSETEISKPLKIFPAKYQIVKLYDGQTLRLKEYTDDILEASGRIEYLNNNSWKSFYMVRKRS